MIIKQDVYYPPNDANRTLHIWLPDDYEHSGERYPVTYFFDGHNLFSDAEATYGKSWGLASFLSGWEKKMIVVGMECSHVGNQRLDEYCPYPRHIMGVDVRPLGRETFRWIVETIKPMTDERFRTWGHREATAIAGSSMGGLMSAYGVIVHNDVFGKAACLSTGCRFNNKFLLADLERSHIDPDTRVYLSWGEHESGVLRGGKDPSVNSTEAHATARLEAALRDRGATTHVYCAPGGDHNEATWEKQNRRYMDFLWLNRIGG